MTVLKLRRAKDFDTHAVQRFVRSVFAKLR